MQFNLTEQGLTKQAPLAVIQGDAGLVATGFNAENDHDRALYLPWLKGRGGKDSRDWRWLTAHQGISAVCNPPELG
jgi:hypothetical protein